MKKAILAVSYGTTILDALRASVEAVENEFRNCFPGYTVFRAFTGRRTMEILEQKQMHVDSVEEALKKIAAEGFEEVILQPTHIIGGSEYESIRSTAEAYKNRFSVVKIGAPLLHSREDMETLCHFFAGAFSGIAEAVVLMGHGSGHEANRLYTEFGEICRALGGDRLFVATLEAKPDIGKILITPLLFVAGTHACKDMAGDGKDSWKSRLEKEGFSVTAVVKGLGEYPEIRALYAGHLAAALSV